MEGKICKISLTILLSFLIQVSGTLDTYRAAVVEYSPIRGKDDAETMNLNSAKFLTLMEQASKKKVQIIVFPEGGLASHTLSPIPDPADNVVPCNGTFKTSKAVVDLSCQSKKLGIYSVVNLEEKRECEADDTSCPPRGYYIFNTNVVFDSKGAVIARYAKYNLFATDTADQPKSPEMVFFDTTFGVRFGTFICFDILFPAPAQKLIQQYKIHNFVYSTFWYSELPFLTALQAQTGWAQTNNVNLLASGINYPSLGSSGSGIYNGKFGHLVQIISEQETTKMLIADVPSNPSNACTHNCMNATLSSGEFEQPVASEIPEEDGLELLKDVLQRYGSEEIKGGEPFKKTVCSMNDFCCDFKIKMDTFGPDYKNYTIRAVAFNGVRNFGIKFRGGAQVCAVVACNGPDIRNCTDRVEKIPGLFQFEEIKIKGMFKAKNSFQMPSTLVDGKQLVPLTANKYEFVRKEVNGVAEVSLELLWPVTDLHTFAIWGRDFTRDNEHMESSATTVVSIPVVLGAFILFALFAR